MNEERTRLWLRQIYVVICDTEILRKMKIRSKYFLRYISCETVQATDQNLGRDFDHDMFNVCENPTRFATYLYWALTNSNHKLS